jgi:hypothetical protein
LLQPEVMQAIDASDLGWFQKKAARGIAPTLLLWALEILLSRYGPALLDLLQRAWPLLEKLLNQDLLRVLDLVHRVLSQPPDQFTPEVRHLGIVAVPPQPLPALQELRP